MSLIHTCEPNDANPFEYLTALQRQTALQRHAEDLAANPAEWMPWKYPMVLEKGLSKAC